MKHVWKLLLALGALAWGPSAHAGSTTLEATYSSGIDNGWVRVERWRDTLTAFTQESFPTDGRGDQTGQRATFFGTARPHSSRFLSITEPDPSLARVRHGNDLRCPGTHSCNRIWR